MKKLLIPFLTEWLINHGTNPTNIDKIGTVTLETFYKAIRKGYLLEVAVGPPVIVKLSKKGIQFLQENQK
jgi:hypothetical protein